MSGRSSRLARGSGSRTSGPPRLKKILLTMVTAGGLTFVTVGGTYATSSLYSTTGNKGATVGTGTLTFTNQVNSGTVCASYGAGSTANVNATCSAVITSGALAYPGVPITSDVTITNNGSIDGGDLSVFMASCTPGLTPSAPTNPYWASITLSSALSTGSAITSLPVTALANAVTSGDRILLTSGANTQTFVASANALINATSISVTSQTPNFAYPTSSTVLDEGPGLCASGGAQFTIQEVSATLSSALSTGAPITSLPTTALSSAVSNGDSIVLTSGTNTQTFVASASALVNATSISVTSQTPNFAYPTTSAVTDTRVAIHLSSALSTASAITSLPVTSLGQAVTNGDSIVVTSGANTQTFVASANALAGATSIPVVSQTPNFAFPTSSTVNDVTPDICWYPNQGGMTCTAIASTLKTFVVNFNSTSSSLDLGAGPPHGQSRYFVVGMQLASSAGNPLQGESATFPLTWHLST
jgi:hypothetical protein